MPASVHSLSDLCCSSVEKLQVLGCATYSSLVLAPMDDYEQRSGLSWWPSFIVVYLGLYAIMCAMMPFSLMAGPATVSDECEDLSDALNNIRLNDHTQVH